MGYSTDQLRAAALAAKCSGSLSICGSFAILWDLWLRKRLQQCWKRCHPTLGQPGGIPANFPINNRGPARPTLHGLLLGISVFDILSSATMVVGSWAINSDTDAPAYQPSGNDITCAAQGFLIQSATPAAPLYNMSMAIYYYLIVNGHWKDHSLQPYQWAFHALPIIFGLVTAMYGTLDNQWGNALLWCWFSGTELSDKLKFALFYGPVWVIFILSASTMMVIYANVHEQERKVTALQKEGNNINQHYNNTYESSIQPNYSTRGDEGPKRSSNRSNSKQDPSTNSIQTNIINNNNNLGGSINNSSNNNLMIKSIRSSSSSRARIQRLSRGESQQQQDTDPEQANDDEEDDETTDELEEEDQDDFSDDDVDENDRNDNGDGNGSGDEEGQRPPHEPQQMQSSRVESEEEQDDEVPRTGNWWNEERPRHAHYEQRHHHAHHHHHHNDNQPHGNNHDRFRDPRSTATPRSAGAGNSTNTSSSVERRRKRRQMRRRQREEARASKAIFFQGLSYTLAFSLTFSFATVFRLWQVFAEEAVPFWMLFLFALTLPLQGFLNFLVFSNAWVAHLLHDAYDLLHDGMLWLQRKLVQCCEFCLFGKQDPYGDHHKNTADLYASRDDDDEHPHDREPEPANVNDHYRRSNTRAGVAHRRHLENEHAHDDDYKSHIGGDDDEEEDERFDEEESPTNLEVQRQSASGVLEDDPGVPLRSPEKASATRPVEHRVSWGGIDDSSNRESTAAAGDKITKE